MSAQNSRGIQTLLEAERKAHEIVQNARAYRTQRLKASKTDASAEINAHKEAKEKEFQKYQQEHTGNSSKAKEDAEATISKELKEIRTKATAAKDAVVQKLIDAVTDPKPTLHINAH